MGDFLFFFHFFHLATALPPYFEFFAFATFFAPAIPPLALPTAMSSINFRPLLASLAALAPPQPQTGHGWRWAVGCQVCL